MRQPHVAQILTEEMALHDVPAAHLGRQRDDAVRPEDRGGIGLGEHTLVDLPHQLTALVAVERVLLTIEEIVDGAVVRASACFFSA
jgi:hypothetical protein